MDKLKIAKRLRALRKAKGATVYDVARECKITAAAVCMYESGERIPRDPIKVKLAGYFGKSVGSIFFDE